MTFIVFSIAARFVDDTVEAKLTRIGIATPTLDPLLGVTEDMEGSVPVPVDWFGVVVGPADVLGFEAAVLGPPVVADTDVGAADDVVVVAEDAAVEVSGADDDGPGPALWLTAVLAHPVSSSSDPATAAPANLFPTAVPPLDDPHDPHSVPALTTPGPRLWLPGRSKILKATAESAQVATDSRPSAPPA
ncbi:hypothetical protein [Catenulispora sp. EB89]|uniref:hypothetical protein n=1 Tax=Catenulispora sp. EB89 TaxID=3156257 RepID=UPI003510E50F